KACRSEANLPADNQSAPGAVRVEGAREEEHQEERHAGVPDARRAADEGQQQLPDQRLDEEEERGPGEQGDGEEDREQVATSAGADHPERQRGMYRCTAGFWVGSADSNRMQTRVALGKRIVRRSC